MPSYGTFPQGPFRCLENEFWSKIKGKALPDGAVLWHFPAVAFSWPFRRIETDFFMPKIKEKPLPGGAVLWHVPAGAFFVTFS